VAHAIVLHGHKEADPHHEHIYHLAEWLSQHPAPSTKMGMTAKTDRERSLVMWVNKVQLVARA